MFFVAYCREAATPPMGGVENGILFNLFSVLLARSNHSYSLLHSEHSVKRKIVLTSPFTVFFIFQGISVPERSQDLSAFAVCYKTRNTRRDSGGSPIHRHNL